MSPYSRNNLHDQIESQLTYQYGQYDTSTVIVCKRTCTCDIVHEQSTVLLSSTIVLLCTVITVMCEFPLHLYVIS